MSANTSAGYALTPSPAQTRGKYEAETPLKPPNQYATTHQVRKRRVPERPLQLGSVAFPRRVLYDDATPDSKRQKKPCIGWLAGCKRTFQVRYRLYQPVRALSIS